MCETDTDDPKVVFSSDRMVTTHQESAIEHKHPETKISEIGGNLTGSNFVCIIAGSVQYGNEYKSRLEESIELFVHQEDEEPWVSTVATLAKENYQSLIQDKINDHVLSTYGLEMDDLSKQHQFKDQFLNNILAKVQQVEQEVISQLVVLIGGVGIEGGYNMQPAIYEISNNNKKPHNDMGYATIGSGTQPAESEFIQTDYSKQGSVEETIATVTAANYQAASARGVGGEADVFVVSKGRVKEVDEETVSELMDTHSEIESEQEDVREKHLSNQDIEI